MGIVVRQSIKSVIVTLGGVVMGAAIAVLSTRFFPKEELGFRENLIKLSIWISYMGIFGYNYTLIIFAQKYPPGHPKRSSFLFLVALFPILFTLFISVAYFLFFPSVAKLYKNGNDMQMMLEYSVLFPLLTMFSVVILWFESYLQSLNKTALQNFAREILARIVYIVLIFAYGLQYISFKQFIWLYVITYIIPLGYLVFFAARNKGFQIKYVKGAFSRSEIFELFRFSGYHMLTLVSTVLVAFLDTFIVGPVVGLEAFAIYSLAALAISMLRNPTRVIGVAVTPTFAQCYNEGDTTKLAVLFNRSAVNMQVIAVAMVALVYINAHNLLSVVNLIQTGYEQVKVLILVLLVGQFADMITGLNYELLGVSKYYKFNFWIALGLLGIIVVLNFLFIQRFGLVGAAMANSIGLICFNIVKTIFLWKKMNLQPFSRKSLLIFVVGLVVAVLGYLIPYLGNVWLDAIIRSGAFTIVLWFCFYKLDVSEDLTSITKNIIHKKRLY